MLSRLFIVALWSHAALVLMFNCVFVTFPCGTLGQVWYLIVSIPDFCRLSFFVNCLQLQTTLLTVVNHIA